MKIVERILLDTHNIKRLAEQFSCNDQGQLAVATTHTQAQYVIARSGRAVQTGISKSAPRFTPIQPQRDCFYAT